MEFYPDREIRLQINKMIEDKTLTRNACFLCLAHLNELIEYSEGNYERLISQRNSFARLLKSNGLDNKVILDKILRIHNKSYLVLTLKKIKVLFENIQNGNVTFVEETIFDEYIEYKAEEDYRLDLLRITRTEQNKLDEKYLQDIVDFIKNNFERIPVEQICVKKIKLLCNKQGYTFDWMLNTMKVFSNVITDAIKNENVNVDTIFDYFLGVVKNEFKDRDKYIKHNEVIKKDNWCYNAYGVYKGDVFLEEQVKYLCEQEPYRGKELEVKINIKRAVQELRVNEGCRNSVEREREEDAYRSKELPEYKSREKQKKINPRLEELW